MPIRYRIDHSRRLVVAAGHGTFTREDAFAYQRTVWSRGDVAGYDELIDMTDVTHVAAPSPEGVQQLAEMGAAMESSSSSSRFAIIAPTDITYGLGRMFQAFRSLADGDTRKVEVFRRREDAMAFLDLDEIPEVPASAEIVGARTPGDRTST